MTARLSQSISLCQRLELPQALGVNPILGLTPQELELLLDEILKSLEETEETENSSRGESNYFNTSAFSKLCGSARKNIPPEIYLERPQILVKKGDKGKVSAAYNKEVEAGIEAKLKLFRRDDNPLSEWIFSRRFKKERAWIREQQECMAEYLVREQERYVHSGNPLDLQRIGQEDVAKAIGYSTSTASRLSRNLAIQLPNKRVIFAAELMPSHSIDRIKGVYALQQLNQDKRYFDAANRRWRVPQMKVRDLLRERFALDMARRTVAKYMRIAEQQSAGKHKKNMKVR